MTDEYWRSTSLMVLDAVQQRIKERDKLVEDIHRFEQAYGAKPVLTCCFLTGNWQCIGARVPVITESRLPGQWGKPDVDGIRKPYRRNEKGISLLRSLDRRKTPIPGFPQASAIVEDGVVFPRVFLYEGIVYGRNAVGCSLSQQELLVDEMLWKRIGRNEYQTAARLEAESLQELPL